VLVSTHYMDEAAHCDRLGLMHQGRLIAIGSPKELRRASEERSGRLLVIHAPDLREAYDRVAPRCPGALLYGDSIHVRTFAPEADRLAIGDHLARCGVEHARIEAVPLSMDETFIDFIQREERAHA
jgi:ABC-2 type transport system ATP-binding protein